MCVYHLSKYLVTERKEDLDITIMNNNNLIEFDLYSKPTFSGRVLSFLSQHPSS